MQPTRQQIIDLLHREHSSSVRTLAGTLSMTATGVRQHLAVLEREGLVAAETGARPRRLARLHLPPHRRG
jgi:predicted ArsR family transcriptional regulator